MSRKSKNIALRWITSKAVGARMVYNPPARFGDPDVMAVAQLNRICGMAVPNGYL